jgi:hypothetical protein
MPKNPRGLTKLGSIIQRLDDFVNGDPAFSDLTIDSCVDVRDALDLLRRASRETVKELEREQH